MTAFLLEHLPVAPARPAPDDARRPVRILVGTDPICSRCWAMEPALRRLRVQHPDVVTVARAYGGLLPRWYAFHDRDFDIRVPRDVETHWRRVARSHGQPIDPSVWRTDPLPSSYPPSIALHAVRRLEPALEEPYLRRLRQALFLEARNIAREEVLLACAADVGLDWETVARHVGSSASAASFAEELRALRGLGVDEFPTLLVEGAGHPRPRALRGPQSYGALRAAVEQALGAPLPPDRPLDVAAALAAYGTGTAREFGELLELDAPAAEAALRAAGARVDDLASGRLWRA